MGSVPSELPSSYFVTHKRTSDFKVSRVSRFQSFTMTVQSDPATRAHFETLKLCHSETRGAAEAAPGKLQLVLGAIRGRRQHLVRGRSGHGIAVLVDLHAQAQTHRGEDLFDLVQRLAAEILRL